MLETYQLVASGTVATFLLGLVYYVCPVLVVLALWKGVGMKPSGRAIYVSFIWLCLGIIASVFPFFSNIWWGALVLLGLFFSVDLIALLMVKPLQVTRNLPGRFAINKEGKVDLTVKNSWGNSVSIRLYDGLPEEGESDDLPWTGEVPAGGFRTITYQLRIRERGRCCIDRAHIEYSSLLKLWTRQVRVGKAEETRVYPNYEPVIQFALLAMASHPEQMGIVMKNRAGMSKDFHQLRDYQLGDTLSKVDWKATSRKLNLISRDYQEQRDQTIILAVDCGQRMRAMDGDIPQFDHCLNAMLLLAYVALKQGDHVGILSFGGEEKWLSPVKGINSMTTILNHLYDYQTSTSPSDYAEAAKRLLVRQQRRSLVVFLSNIRGEDGADLIDPLRLVRKKHVTILANLREKEVVERMGQPVENLDDALALGATQKYLDERSAVLKDLSSHGINSVDATAQDLPVALANKYLMAREEV